MADLAVHQALREDAHSPMTRPEQAEHDDWLARLRDEAGPGLVDAALAAGRRLAMADAVALATEEPNASAT